MMNPPLPNPLAHALRDFFTDHLPRLRGLSPHTLLSYRDSLALLLRFVADRHTRALVSLDLADLDTDAVIAFLQHLETDRHNSAATRNVRLAAIHAFFRYLAVRHPDLLEHSQRILAVPFTRARIPVVDYLEYEEIQAVLASVDRHTVDGRRDFALLVTMFNTGARVQEILDVRPCDLQLINPFQVRLVGKGRKERICPLWPETAQVLRAHLSERHLDSRSKERLVRNHRGEHLARFGVRYILAKYCAQAAVAVPTLRGKRLHPHSIRHSTAVHLLKAGVDLTTIRHWLGHASINTTNRYASVDLEMKREAIEREKPLGESPSPAAPWHTDASILEWLEAL
jgi:site-specific recombinase XerD